jgi:hypothetical protein
MFRSTCAGIAALRWIEQEMLAFEGGRGILRVAL